MMSILIVGVSVRLEIEIIFHDEEDVPVILPEDVPLNKWPDKISQMPCYFIYLNPGIIEFNLPISHRDVLQLRFQISYLMDDILIKQQLNQIALNFAQRLIKTLRIKLSDKESTLSKAPLSAGLPEPTK